MQWDTEDYQIGEPTWVSIKICVYAEVAKMMCACMIHTCRDERTITTTESAEKEIKSISCPLGEQLGLVMGRCIKGMSAFLRGCPCLLGVEVQVSVAG